MQTSEQLKTQTTGESENWPYRTVKLTQKLNKKQQGSLVNAEKCWK